MEKITLEKIENDYKEAIRNKFRIEKEEGKHAHYLSNPSQALLRDLCWEIFTSNPKSDDLNVYRNFFRTDFKSEENTSIQYTNKFKKVGGFYRGEKDPANISTVELAAILVDFHPRPFNKFKKELPEEDLKLINELRGHKLPEVEVSPNEEIEKKETESFIDPTAFFTTEEPEPIQDQKLTLKETPDSIQTIAVTEEKPKYRRPIFDKLKYIAITGGLFIICLILYFALTKKQCMQWSQDHYELVDCDFKADGIVISNPIEIFDASLVNLKKIEACSGTNCFDKRGDAIIWYAKTANGIDFFNDHGRHPENNNALRPVTHYIFNKYLKDKPCK